MGISEDDSGEQALKYDLSETAPVILATNATAAKRRGIKKPLLGACLNPDEADYCF